MGTHIRDRKLDLFFVICFSFFAFSSAFSDALHTLGMLDGEGFWADANRGYGEAAGDQLFLAAPEFLSANVGISAFVYGPFYLLLVYAFLRGANWIRIPAFVYVGALLHGITEFFYWEFVMGPSPTQPAIFFAFNGPYLIVPLLLAWRMRKPQPFGPD